MTPAPMRMPDRPCTLVVAVAGYGKTTLVRRLLRGATARWYSQAEGAQVLDQVARDPTGVTEVPDPCGFAGPADVPADTGGSRRRHWLVLDDAARLPAARLRAVLCAAARLPERLRLVLLTRHPPSGSAITAASRRGVLGLLGPADLAKTGDEVAALLRDEHDLADPALARSVYAATAGWPALVRLAARSIAAPAGTRPQSLIAAGTPAEAYPERTSLALDIEQVDLDVELFRAEAPHGLRLLERGETADAGEAPALPAGGTGDGHAGPARR